MKLIGQKLRSKRESLGMTLIDLEKKVKIQKKYIEMIEKNEFDRLPNPDYTRGFIEKYARAVNLNSSDLLTLHEEELPDRKMSAKEASKKIKTETNENAHDNSAHKLLFWLFSILLILFLIWLIFTQFIFTDKNNEWKAENVNKSRNVKIERTTEQTMADSKENINQKNKDTQSEPESKTKSMQPLKLTYKNFDGANLAYEVETNEPIQLKIVSKVPTWVQVYDNQKKNYAYKEMKKEIMKIDKSAKNITLISGNSTSMDVYINDKKVSVPKEAENLITRTYFFKILK